jgi:dTDP-L-rhamnose 4-epimerase
MYAVDRYVSVNDYGTAVLFQQLIDNPVKRVVVASSMSIYGEGLYRTGDGKVVEDVVRKPRGGPGEPWDPLGPDGLPLVPVATPEWKRPTLASVYALTKYVQERLTLTLAPAYGMEGVALRLWNVYGPGQALSNPYTGVLAIFSSRLHNGQPPMIFEDGQQRRDFVHVEDVAQAFALALEHEKAPGQVYNVGSGQDRTVSEVAQLLAHAMNRTGLDPEITGKARLGDIRHCIADISKIRSELGYAPRRDFSEGLAGLRTGCTRPARNSRCGASWHDGPRHAPPGADDPRPAPDPGDRRGGVHRLEPRRPPRARRPQRPRLRRPCPPRGRAQSRLAQEAPPPARRIRDGGHP